MNRLLLPAAAAAAAVLAPFAGVAQQARVTFSGEVRLRAELHPAWEAPILIERPDDDFTLLRSRFMVVGHANERARIGVQLQDARVFGEEATTMEGDADALDLHQAWLELDGHAGRTELRLRAGRQEIALYNERLVGAVAWSNTGRSFDAVRLHLARADAGQGGLFVAALRESSDRFASTAPVDDDHLVVGIYGTAGVFDATALFDRDAVYRTFLDVDRMTVYGRAYPDLGVARLEIEAAYQLGSQTPAAPVIQPVRQDIGAWLLAARVARAVGTAANAWLGVDWLSGDRNPGDDSYSMFNTLYATNHKFYGFFDDVIPEPGIATADRGLIDALVGASLALGRFGTPRVDLHRFLLDEPYFAGRDIGWELDVVWPFSLAAAGLFELGWSAYLPGEAGGALLLGTEGELRHWIYTQLRVAF